MFRWASTVGRSLDRLAQVSRGTNGWIIFEEITRPGALGEEVTDELAPAVGPERLKRGVLGLTGIVASTMANIGPAMSFYFSALR